MRDQNAWLTLTVEDEGVAGEVRVTMDRRISLSSSRETHVYTPAQRPVTEGWLANVFAELLALEEKPA